MVDTESSLEESPIKTKRGRVIKKKITNLKYSSGSETEDKYDSDDSFLVMTSESDSEGEYSSAEKKQRAKKRDEIVYLDLTNQEIEEVSLESCQSPGANRSEYYLKNL